MAALVHREEHDPGIVRLSLAHGGGNPLSRALVEALARHLDALAAAPPRALVLDGGGAKLFSGGFDLSEVLTLSVTEVRAFFRTFFEQVARLTELACPTIAAIHGSAIAGGFILSLACDLRVVADAPLRLGLTEVDLGVAVPPCAQVLLRARTSEQASLRLGVFGTLFGAEEAHTLGYADALAADAQAEALALARALARKPGRGVAVTKTIAARPLAAAVRAAETAHFDAFFETWLSDEAQATLRGLADRLAQRADPPAPADADDDPR